MSLKFISRGHGQSKPLAVAYDWLYDQWTQEQRAHLRGKLVEAGDYLIYRIREKQQLSPYNVYLYNSPFQALMATAIALYGDDPRGEPIMRYTYDYWKNRVLPVWRQVMGNNGGWHEGGEYVGIGIGQAIYQVPAMWRKATGEDIFASMPGIRGFLDFLVYRTRPDGTHFRWGDGGFWDKRVPDRVPLAIEYQHAPAYSLGRCPRRLEPTSWPWGPLPRASFCDPKAIEKMPPARHFDGIGLVVARNSWSPDATYITFKAGDNYWSHSHLDQGAFTIYKGGALAIDSGIYHNRTDHFLNYSRQTIAHNTITVTDWDDTVPAAGRDKKPERNIANDGGQRRIGSGWGFEAAPFDRAEWEEKTALYHTATMHNAFFEDDLVVAVADVTPAYTNTYSGEGTFSHRTRRVERFVRTFAYDRANDVILIFDRVVSTEAHFSKRWLLHTIDQPSLTAKGFHAWVPPTEDPRQGGGQLTGRVLLPKNANISLVGGVGQEFYVDGENFDDNDTIYKLAAKRRHTEPGSWRIEIRPSKDAYEDMFLVVMKPSKLNEHGQFAAKLLEEKDRLGAEIAGSRRTTRWWFDEAHEGPIVEVLTPGEPDRRHDLRTSAQSQE
jgi:hypothetical protein